MAGSLTYHYSVNKTFDPWSQSFVITTPDGVSTYTAYVSEIMTLQRSAVNQAICQSTQIGAALILLLALMLITKTDKRRSFVFILNALALFFVVLRGVLSLSVFTGPFYDWYRWELAYYQGTDYAKHISSAAEVMTFFVTLTIEISLVLQVRIICCNLEPRRRHAINIFNVSVALAAVGIRFALMVVNITWSIEGLETETEWQFHTISRLASATNITLVMSIGISAVIFCTKLAFAIEARRSMGMTQFGPMQIIFVMGCQTMCTPLIFTIIAYFVVKNAQIGSFVPTVVAISLPLSAMWAAVNTSNVHIANSDPRQFRKFPVGGPDLASGKAYGKHEFFTSTSNTNSTLVDDDSRALTSVGGKPRSLNSAVLEMQKMSEGVQVDRSYSVRTD